MPTFKVCLTEEQWLRVCQNDEEIATEVAKQQPELAEKSGFELVTIVRRKEPEGKQAKGKDTGK